MIGLEYIRRQYSMPSTEIASILGVSRQVVSKWEKAEKIIPPKRLSQLSIFFDMPEEYFQEEVPSVDKIDVERIFDKRKCYLWCDDNGHVGLVKAASLDDAQHKVFQSRGYKIKSIFLLNNGNYDKFGVLLAQDNLSK